MPRLATPLDIRWYNEFRNSGGSIMTHYYLHGILHTRRQQKERFIEGKIRNPRLDYPRINIHFLENKISDLQTFHQRLLAEEKNPIITKAYHGRCEEGVVRMQLLQAASQGDMATFQKKTEYLFGLPSPVTFTHTLAVIWRLVTESAESKSRWVRAAADELEAVLPIVTSSVPDILPPTALIESTFAHVVEQLKTLIALPDERTKWGGQAVQEVFTQALNHMGLYEWSALMLDTQYYLSVEHNHKEIRIPQSRIMGRAKLLALLVHEIGTHVVRRVNGLQSPLLLLGSGLDHYEVGEEGIATLFEEAVNGHFKAVIRPERYLAIGLAMGLADKSRDFRGVYEVLLPFFYLRALRRGQERSHAKALAQTHAWETCIRAFRGTDCHTAGVCYTKDIIYQDGNLRIWQVLRDHPEELYRFSVGKYDPANEDHRQLLDQLNLKPIQPRQ